ncbi:MAG TPA: methyltransferase domain-containing protein [Planctomycetota bacterium]|jgi:SAM-dependent methyltransferase
MRKVLAQRYLHGEGIEIGALHQPLALPRGAHARYVDRHDVAGLRASYPELAGYKLVNVDVIDDGEKLAKFGDSSLDFVIANHFLEHAQDPLGTITHLLRVLKPGGVIYMAVPDKRWTFDAPRPVTPLEHIYRDHAEGPGWSREEHYREYASLVDKVPAAELDSHCRKLMEANYSIHFHVWTQDALAEMLVESRRQLSLRFDLIALMLNREQNESICILTRI